jgi:hypothetical protein
LLTLIVVPVLYSFLDDLAEWTKRRLGPKEVAGGAIPAHMPASKE